MSKKSKVERVMRNLSQTTQNNYWIIIHKYEKFHGMDIEELICEALDEQTNQVPSHMLHIIDRLEDFQQYLIDEGFVLGSVKTYMTRIKTIYKKCRVNLPYIESIDPKTVKRNDYIEFKHILTKEEIKLILTHMSLPAQAKAYAMIQGGLSHKECEQLMTRTFIDETYKYHQCDDDVEALKWLADETHPIIWVTCIIRIKTKKPYYLIVGSEAVNKIAECKLYEMTLPKHNYTIPEKLFAMSKIGFSKTCRELNDRLELGVAGGFCRCRPHMLRKFHSTYISGSALNYEEQSLISNSEIDEMQGRGKTSVQDTYIKTNPLRQKTLYAKVMNNVSLYHKYDYKINDGDVHVFLVDIKKENEKLKNEVKNLEHQLQQKQKASEKVNALRKELGDDVLMEMVQGILDAS